MADGDVAAVVEGTPGRGAIRGDGRPVITRQALHRQAVRRAARRLRNAGHKVVIRLRHPRDEQRGDLWVDNRLWVAVRGTVPHEHEHTVNVGGRRYTYRYPRVLHNLTAHGRRVDPDFWAFVRLDTGRVCFVPGQLVGHRMTVNLLVAARLPESLCHRPCSECLSIIDREQAA